MYFIFVFVVNLILKARLNLTITTNACLGAEKILVMLCVKCCKVVSTGWIYINYNFFIFKNYPVFYAARQ